jgi:excisionase family DNA binding protein
VTLQSRPKYQYIPRKSRVATLTTGDIAKLCEVAPRTVSKWIDTHKLKGYRIPGSNDRRVLKRDLIDFMQSSGMPVPPSLRANPKVLWIGVDLVLVQAFLEMVSPYKSFDTEMCMGIIEASSNILQSVPEVAVIGTYVGRDSAVDLITTCRKAPHVYTTFVRLMPEDGGLLPEANLNVACPCDPSELTEAITCLLES